MKKLKLVLTPSKPPLLARLTKQSGNWMFLGQHGWKWVADTQKAKVLTRGVKARPLRFKHDHQVKYRIGRWLAKPRLSVPLAFGDKRLVLGIVFIVVLLGGIAIAQGPAFHSYVENPLHCMPTPQEANGGIPCGDPSTLIWRATAPEGDLGEFVARADNCITACAAYAAGCITGINCVSLNPTNTVTAQVLTKAPIGDIGIAAGKTLAFHVSWTFSGAGGVTWANQNSWGYYLTTNSTVPATANYDPAKDPNVVFQVKVFCTGTCAHGSSAAYRTYVYALRVLGKGDTIDNERLGTNCAGQASGVNGTATSCFDSTFNSVVADNAIAAATYLNFTGATNGSTNCAIVSNVFTGPTCSWVFGSQESSSVVGIGVQDLPFFSFPATQYYLGLYAIAGNTAATQFTFDTYPNNVKGNLDSFVFVPTPTAAQQPPNIDTGGFFGPIIKALINLGVFILQELITVFTFVVNVVKAALDAIGGFVGLGAIGTALFSILSAAGSFISSVITAIGTQLANIVGFLTNAANAIVAFLGSGGSFIWTQVSNFFGIWQVLFPLFNTVFLLFTAFSQNGVQIAQYALIFWWLYGIFVVLENGTEKWWSHWVGMGEDAFKKTFNLGYWLVELVFHWLVWLKNLLAQWV